MSLSMFEKPKLRTKHFFWALFFVSIFQGAAVRSEERPTASAKAGINDIAWLAGHWRSEKDGAISEETWFPPLGGAMSGTFREVKDGKVVFYEFMSISPHDGSLLLKIKHFNPDMTGWEEKDKSVVFSLVSLDDKVAKFDGIVFEKHGADGLRISVNIRDDDGSVKNLAFDFTKSDSFMH